MDNATQHVGIHFRPTPKELIVHYLLKKVMDEPLPSNHIRDCDLYSGDWRKILEEGGGMDAYFFTKLKKKNEKGSKTERVVGGCGTWKETQRSKEIFASFQGSRIQVGMKRSFKFIANDGVNIKGKWLMEEFNLHDSFKELNKADNYVICRVKNELKGQEKRRM